MLKAAAAATLVLGMGAGVTAIFAGVLGTGAEAAALAVSGAGLWAASFGLGRRVAARPARAARGAQAGAQS